MREVNLFIAGSPKSGTSTLATYLSASESFFVPRGKEPHICNSNFYNSSVLTERLKVYSNASDEQYIVDATPNYFIVPEKVSEYLKFRSIAVEDVKLIFILRDPFERLSSHYKHNKSRLAEERSFDVVIKDEIEKLSVGEKCGYLDYSLYGKWLTEWDTVFPKNQKLILYTKNLKKIDNILEKLSGFLGVEVKNVNVSKMQQNVGGIPRSKTIMKVLQKENIFKKLIRKIMPFPIRLRIRRNLLKMNLKHSPKNHRLELSSELKMKLDFIFEEDGKLFEAFLKKTVKDGPHESFLQHEISTN